MKNIIVSGILLIFSLTGAFSQKVKQVEICKGQYGVYSLYASITYEIDQPKDTLFIVFGKNNRYTHITDLINLKAGSFNDVWNFFTYCMEFLNKEEEGMSETYKGNLISVTKTMGFKVINIYGEGKDASGWTGFNEKYLDKLLSCMEEWEAKSKKVSK
jgi:hypothetical protein